jgi:hypothetical protein
VKLDVVWNKIVFSYSRYIQYRYTIFIYKPTICKKQINGYAQKSMGIDPGFGSSAFGVVVTQFVDSQIQLMHAEEYEA